MQKILGHFIARLSAVERATLWQHGDDNCPWKGNDNTVTSIQKKISGLKQYQLIYISACQPTKINCHQATVDGVFQTCY
jgi:hypothetical protein